MFGGTNSTVIFVLITILHISDTFKQRLRLSLVEYLSVETSSNETERSDRLTAAYDSDCLRQLHFDFFYSFNNNIAACAFFVPNFVSPVGNFKIM